MPADVLILNGRFRTMDPAVPQADALALAHGRILAVGRQEDVHCHLGPGTKVMDAGGRLGLPGFWDSHFHFRDWSLGRQQIDFSTARSFEEFLEYLRHAAMEAHGRGGDVWVLGQGWNETDWPESRAPFRDDLDGVIPDVPALLWRCDLHLAVANSKALELAGISESNADMLGGEIGKDAQGRINGHLREGAINRVRKVLPPATDSALYEAMRQGMRRLNALGITGLHDVKLMAEAEASQTLRVWQRLRNDREMTLRSWVSLADSQLDAAADLGVTMGLGDAWLRLGHVKFFADGGMGARTAWMLEPYLDAGCGLPLWDVEELYQAVDRAEEAGFPVMIHAIGNRATREVLSLYEKLEAERTGSRVKPPLRHRIEHLQMVEPEDLARLKRLPLAVCMQPHNMILDINMINRSLGERGAKTYTFKDVLDAGVPLMLSSDAPVCDPSPLVGIHAAVTRQRPGGDPQGGWYPAQRLSVEEAVMAYTCTPAQEYGVWEDQGSLSSGKRADLILLNKDIFSCDPMEILETKLDMAMVAGKTVYGGV